MAVVSLVLLPPFGRDLVALVARAAAGPAGASEVVVAGRPPPEAAFAGRSAGAAPRALAEATRGDVVVTLSGDGRDDPRFIAALVEAVRDGAALAVASRYAPEARDESPLGRRFATRAANGAASALLALGVRDVTSPFRAYARETLAFLADARGGLFGRVHAIALAERRRLSVAEIPVVSGRPPGGFAGTVWRDAAPEA